jgi:hypothetical protein
MGWFNFRPTRQPTAGTGSAAFLMPTTLPILQTIGPGRNVNYSFRPHQPPQVYQTKTAPVAGVGGLISNGVIFQPLQK